MEIKWRITKYGVNMTRPKSGYTLLERLLNKVIVNDVTDCWEWQGGKNNIGYGMMRDENRMRTIHRVSYEEHSQTKIPAGMSVMHSCDNPLCANPAHLSVGTHQQNMLDMYTKGRAKVFGGIGMRGKKQPRTICPHCNRSIANNLFARHHGDNCKLKP
jgi:hypothetical protein